MHTQIKIAELALSKKDPLLGKIISTNGTIEHTPSSDYFHSLSKAIISQQVSVAAANTIFGRFREITEIEPQMVLMMSDEHTKVIGLSRQKAGYLKDLAQHFVENPDVYNHLDKATDSEVITELTAIKGVGPWTAKMFLMFTLIRLDVFAADDIGIQRAMKNLLDWKEAPTVQEIEAHAEKWRPYRTIACWHLWKSLNNSL